MSDSTCSETRRCLACGSSFEVSASDKAFYNKVSPSLDGETIAVPAPTRCPPCRLQRRLAYRAEFYYHPRECAGCKKSVVSIFPKSYPAPVYCYSCWWGSSWSPESYGKPIDFSRPFFDQFRDLHHRVPQVSLVNDNGVQSENCEYTHDFSYGKNCYLVTATWHSDGSMYSTQINHTREIFDSYFVINQSELVYESLYSSGLYSCTFLAHSSGCTNCQFGYDLKGCADCIGCVGLRRKRFCLFNEELSEATYREKTTALGLDTHTGQAKMYRAFEEFRARFPHRALHQLQCEEAIGEALVECKDFSGYLVSHGQYCRHAWCGDRITNCHDVISTGLPEWCYEGNTPDESYQCLFTIYCWKGKYILYSDNCHSSEHLFGCIALKRSKHCILNVAYTQHEYERNARKLLHHMRETGEWGEFFPLNYSPFPYNESRAFDVFPLAKSSAQNLGLLWGEDRVFSSTGATTLPEGIDDVPESIVTAPLTCSGCCRQYKILKLELAFYRKLRLPIPRLCPHCRRTARFERFPSTGAVYQRQCVTCHTSIPSAFSPNRQEQVVCEACYLKGLEE